MKKFYKFIVIVSVLIILTFVEVIIIKAMNDEKPTKKVAIAIRDINELEEVSNEVIKFTNVDVNLVPENAITEKDLEKGVVVNKDIYKSQVLVKQDLMDKEKMYKTKSGCRLIAIEPKADEANAWQIKKGDIVDVVCISNEKEVLISDLTVASIIDDQFNNYEKDSIPKLIILEAEIEKAIKIATFKTKGNVSILTHRMGGLDEHK